MKVKMTDSESTELLNCYNKGCGKKFDPKENKEDSCCFHPGNPVFHDAYKGWSCCSKKSIDFTEFLNLKGCARSFHSNVKPPEPEKRVVDKSKASEVYEYKPHAPRVVQRPPITTPLVTTQPKVSNLLRSQLEALVTQHPNAANADEIQIGTSCKNSGCKVVYQGETTEKNGCVYHSGAPVFHEGFKYWSCCNKRTTDFSVFLEQVGCTVGDHVWSRERSNHNQPNCRYDWHQTPSHVFISVYAKKYDPDKSIVQINPIRVKLHLEFPVDGTQFDKDLELCGVIDVDKCTVSMLPTKVEVKLKKSEPGSWSRLDVPGNVVDADKNEINLDKNKSEMKTEDDSVDLEDIN